MWDLDYKHVSIFGASFEWLVEDFERITLYLFLFHRGCSKILLLIQYKVVGDEVALKNGVCR